MISKYLKTAVVLMAICAVAAILLAFVNQVTAPVINSYEQRVVEEALKEVSCGLSIGKQNFVPDDSSVTEFYTLSDGSTLKGYLLQIKSNGYGGELSVVASFDTEGRVMDAKLANNGETPGVGKKAEIKGYMNKFVGKGAEETIPTKKNQLSEVDSAAVSGATMTFTGISKALTAGSEFVKKMGGAK